MQFPTKTPRPPYFVVIFTSARADGNNDDGYFETAQRLPDQS